MAAPTHRYTYALGTAAVAAAARPSAPGPVDGVPHVHRRQSDAGRDAGGDLAEPARRHASRGAPGASPGAAVGAGAAAGRPPAADGGVRRPDPRPRSRCARCCRPTSAARWRSGRAPTAPPIGPGRFRDDGHDVVRDRRAAPAATSSELHADAELGSDRHAVMRVMIADRPEGPARDASQRVLLGDPPSAGYRAFRAGIAEYLVADAAELARRGQSRRQGSGAGAVRQHLQQPRTRRVRHQRQIPAQRPLLHQQHRRRRRSRAARTRRGTTCSDRGRITMPISACWSITTS